MKNNFKFFLIVLFIQVSFNGLVSQCPTDLTFNTQAEIDAFIIDYPDCVHVVGDIVIVNSSDILNVDGFSNIESIDGWLYLEYLFNLTDLSGFSNLQLITDRLWLKGMNIVPDLSGFSSLHTVMGQIDLVYLPLITDLQGFESLVTIGSMQIIDCDNLENLTGMENLRYAEGGFIFSDNSNLANMVALYNVIASLGVNMDYNYNMGDCTNSFVCEFMAPWAVFNDNLAPCILGENAIDYCVFPPIAPGLVDACQTLPSIEISDAMGNTYKADVFDENGNIVCTIEADGNTLGVTEVELYTSSEIRYYGGVPYMSRDVSIIPEFQPSSDVSVKFYYTAQEFSDLQAADPSILTIEDIYFTKIDGGCQGSYSGGGSEYMQLWSNEYGQNGDWWVRVLIPSFSGFHSQGSIFTLPVEIVKFGGQRNNSDVLLNWTTISEVNNDYFNVHHSTDGRSFDVIGKVEGSGTSTASKHYSFTHKQSNGANSYYRLEQVDYNGEIEYSDVIHVSNEEDKLTLAPNPSNDFIHVRFNSTYEFVTIEIYNLLGSRVRSANISQGEKYDISQLADGIYTIISTKGNQQINTRFVKY